MPKRSQRPVNAERLTTYAELRELAAAFGGGLFNFLMFIGPPGRGKSTIIEAATKDALQIEGHAKPFEIFCQIQEKTPTLIVIDDADGLYNQPEGQRLLKQLTNPKTPKRLGWNSVAPVNRGLQQTFETCAKVCLIDNGWSSSTNEHIAALEDRGRLFLFDPSPEEVHQEMVNRQYWFDDLEVAEFIGENCHLLTNLSFRSYEKAAEEKRANRNWQAYVLRTCLNDQDRDLVLMEYDANWCDKPVEEKCQEYMRRNDCGRATYYARKRDLTERLGGKRFSTLLGKLTNPF